MKGIKQHLSTKLISEVFIKSPLSLIVQKDTDVWRHQKANSLITSDHWKRKAVFSLEGKAFGRSDQIDFFDITF